MNGGSTSNRTRPHRQLPRMLLLIHDSHQSIINSQLVEVVEIRHDFPTATILQPSVMLIAQQPEKTNNSVTRFACRNAINVLRVHQGIRTHRAPTEGSQDKGSCVRPPRFDRRTGKFSSDEVCAGVPTHRSMHSLARCCNRWQPESA